MTYQETLSLIYGLARFGMKPGLERIRATLRALSDPQDAVRVIHVAGTNGKGSTSAFLAAILEAGGHKVGLFTSPHLVMFTERIRVNGREIAEREVCALADRVLSVAPEGTTFFEIVTAMAYLHFAEQGVGPAVMEVGMGGRLDATNIASGILSVITPIAIDHSQYLGTGIGQIAGEKAGVIKRGRPTVISRQTDEAYRVIRRQCAELSSPLYREDYDYRVISDPGGFAYTGIGWELQGLRPGIAGRYQAGNMAAALCAAELLASKHFPLSPESARRGIELASWPGRMELFPGPPRMLLDGAHNPAGARALAESLAGMPRSALILVTGMVGDKDADGILEPLLPLANQVIAVCPSIERGLASRDLADRCRTLGHEAVDGGSVADGLALAAATTRPTDLILVCGSLFVVGEARARILSKKFEPFRG